MPNSFVTQHTATAALLLALAATACGQAAPAAGDDIASTTQAFTDPAGGLSWRLIDGRFPRFNGVPGPVAASSWSSARLDLFARTTVDGPGEQLVHAWYNDGYTFNPWENLGGVIVSEPAAVSWGSGRIDVVAVGTDGALWQIYWDSTQRSTWSRWQSLGGSCIGEYSQSAAVATWGPRRLDVFCVRQIDQGPAELWTRSFDNGWGNWTSLGGNLSTRSSGVTAVATDVGVMDVYVAWADGNIYTKKWRGSWSGWESIGMPPPYRANGMISAAKHATGEPFVFASSSNGKIYKRLYPYDTGWTELDPAVFTGGVTALKRGSKAWDIFAIGDDYERSGWETRYYE